jgi:hypothetical protein
MVGGEEWNARAVNGASRGVVLNGCVFSHQEVLALQIGIAVVTPNVRKLGAMLDLNGVVVPVSDAGVVSILLLLRQRVVVTCHGLDAHVDQTRACGSVVVMMVLACAGHSSVLKRNLL